LLLKLKFFPRHFRRKKLLNFAKRKFRFRGDSGNFAKKFDRTFCNFSNELNLNRKFKKIKFRFEFRKKFQTKNFKQNSKQKKIGEKKFKQKFPTKKNREKNREK